MQKRRNALLLFAKLPEAEKVKTRLSVLKDGVFTPEDAAELFEAMLLDVVDISLNAFEILKLSDVGGFGVAPEQMGREGFSSAPQTLDEYTLYISTAPVENINSMRELVTNSGVSADHIKFIGDSGSSFDEHYNDAFQQVWDDGAECILSMGADMPALSVWDIVRGFDALHAFDGRVEARTDVVREHPGIVISADQAMGVSIVGWTRDTDFNHTGVFYNESGLTVLPAYIEKARVARLPVKLIPPVPDVDTIADLAHNITLLEAAEYASRFGGGPYAKRTIAKLIELGCYEVRVPPNELRDSRNIIDVELPEL